MLPKLVSGLGSLESGEACWASALRYMTHEGDWSDKVPCVDPIINAMMIQCNDMCSDDAHRERLIGPHLMSPLGTLNPGLREKRLSRIVGFAMEQAGIEGFGGSPPRREWPAAQRAATATATATTATATSWATAANAAAAATATTATAAANAAAAAAAAVATIITVVAAQNVLDLILELCAMGEKTEVVQIRPISDLCSKS